MVKGHTLSLALMHKNFAYIDTQTHKGCCQVLAQGMCSLGSGLHCFWCSRYILWMVWHYCQIKWRGRCRPAFLDAVPVVLYGCKQCQSHNKIRTIMFTDRPSTLPVDRITINQQKVTDGVSLIFWTMYCYSKGRDIITKKVTMWKTYSFVYSDVIGASSINKDRKR